MKYFICALAVAITLAQSAKADSIRNFKINNVSISFGINGGGGGNSQFSFIGSPGTLVTGFGSAGCFWCNFDNLFAPGSSLTPDISFLSFEGLVTLKLGGHTFNVDENGTLFDSSISVVKTFTFPANASVPSFTVRIPASLNGPLTGNAGRNATFTQFNLNVPASGFLVLNFQTVVGDEAGNRFFQFSQATYTSMVTPEPGTLAFAAIGLAGIAAIIRKNSRRRKSQAL